MNGRATVANGNGDSSRTFGVRHALAAAARSGFTCLHPSITHACSVGFPRVSVSGGELQCALALAAERDPRDELEPHSVNPSDTSDATEFPVEECTRWSRRSPVGQL